jgi:predicted thioesterase
MCVTLHAEVTGVDGRRVFFKIWAEDEREPVAEGTHERIVINIARFVERLQAKIRGDSA